MLTVVPVWPTVCCSVSELVAKLPSVLYVAVMVLTPGAVSTVLHWPVEVPTAGAGAGASVTVQVSPPPTPPAGAENVTVTVPVGTPAPGTVLTTFTTVVTDWPETDGS